jgi:hypothetical protein
MNLKQNIETSKDIWIDFLYISKALSNTLRYLQLVVTVLLGSLEMSWIYAHLGQMLRYLELLMVTNLAQI